MSGSPCYSQHLPFYIPSTNNRPTSRRNGGGRSNSAPHALKTSRYHYPNHIYLNNHQHHNSPSANANMAKARKLFGGFLKRGRSDKGDFIPPESPPGIRNRSRSQSGSNIHSSPGKWSIGKGSTLSLGGNESISPCASPTGKALPFAGGRSASQKHRNKPWKRQTSPWRSITSPERDDIKKMLRIATEADGQRGHTGHMEKIVIDMVEKIPSDVDVTAVVDPKQRLHLMQWSVINSWHCLLELLLQRGHTADTENVCCNGPLHLACKLDNVHSAELLLRYGASTSTKSTACYPSSSLHLMHDSPYGPSAYCYIHLNSTPLQIALTHDSSNVVKLLLERTSCGHPIEDSLILHTACYCHGDSCIGYILKTAPDSINVRDPETGETPIAVALQEGEATVWSLLNSTAVIDPEVLIDCTGKGDSVLHCLYYTDKCPNVLSLTMVLQERYSSIVNCQDRNGNTPMHILCSRLSRFGQRNIINLECLPDIYLCARHLLDHTDNMNVVNKRGQSPLHLLYSGCSFGLQLDHKYLEAFLSETNKVLKLLLSHGVDPNISSNEVCTVVNTIINQCCALSAEKAKRVGHNFVEAIEIICGFSPDLDTPDMKGIYMLTRLLTACNRMLVSCVGESGEPSARFVFRFIGSILKILFENGMSPPQDILRISIKQLAIMTSTQFDEGGFNRELKEIVGLILCSGLNPNLLKVMCDDLSADDVKTDDLRYCVARGFATHREHQGMMKFMSIFEETLDQDKLNNFNSTICQILTCNFHESYFKHIGETIDRLQCNQYKPRPLKHLCRIAINNTLDWNVSKKKNMLPLPVLLQDYLSSFT